MPLRTSPGETHHRIGHSESEPSVAKNVLDVSSTEDRSNGKLKRKADALYELEQQLCPVGARTLADSQADTINIKKEPGSKETTRGRPNINGISEFVPVNQTASRSSGVTDGNKDQSDISRPSFTPVNKRTPACFRHDASPQLEHTNITYQGVTQAVPQENIGIVAENDKKLLLAAVVEVESKFEREKWDLVVESMKRAGAAEYPKALLRESVRLSKASDNKILNLARFTPSHVNSMGDGYNFVGKSRTPRTIGRNEKSGIGGVSHGSNNGNYQGFGALVNQESLQHVNHIPPKSSHQMLLPGESDPTLSSLVPYQTPLPGSASYNPTTTPVHVVNVQRNSIESSSSPKSYQQPAQHNESSGYKPFDTVLMTLDTSRRSASSSEAVLTGQKTHMARKSKKPISKSLLKYIYRHRTLNDTNRSKPWDVIANECGVDAPLNEISLALEQAGYPVILSTGKEPPISPSELTPNTTTPTSTTYISPYQMTQVNTQATGMALTSTSTSTNSRDYPLINLTTRKPGASQVERDATTERTPPNQVGPRRKNGSCSEPSESRERRSAAMRKAWAKRQAEGRNGRGCGPPKASTIARTAQLGSSPITFATQILAAADATAEGPPPSSSKIRDGSIPSSMTTPVKVEEPPDSAAPLQEQIPSGKDVSQERAKSAVETPALNEIRRITPPKQANRLWSQRQAFRGPSRRDTIRDEKPCPYACDKCGKAYTTPGGLQYHRASVPHCEDGLQKPRPHACPKCGKSYQNRGGLMYHLPMCGILIFTPENRTNTAQTRRISGPRIMGGARVNGLAFSPAAREAQLTLV